MVSKESGTGAASAGFAIGAGSRFGSQGEALTLKHLAFKGTSLRSDIKFARDLESAGLTPMASVGRQTLLFGLRGDAVGVSGEGLEALAEAVISPNLVGWHISEVQAECVNAEINTVSKDPQVCGVTSVIFMLLCVFRVLSRASFERNFEYSAGKRIFQECHS